MIVGGAYQPYATRILNDTAELADEGRALRDAGLPADEATRLELVLYSIDQIDLAVWRSLILPDASTTFRALMAAQKLVKGYARALHALEAQREAATT